MMIWQMSKLLLTKTRDYHWNVEDPRFNDLHKFFEEQYELIDASIDEIAERVRALGSKTRAYIKRIHQFFSNTRGHRFIPQCRYNAIESFV